MKSQFVIVGLLQSILHIPAPAIPAELFINLQPVMLGDECFTNNPPPEFSALFFINLQLAIIGSANRQNKPAPFALSPIPFASPFLIVKPLRPQVELTSEAVRT